MRKHDITIGVEYAETGPLAYGREPMTTPYRVRFTSTESGPWALLHHAEAVQDAKGRWSWQTVKTEAVKERDLPAGITQWPGPAEEGATATFYSAPKIVGSLPAERWYAAYDSHQPEWHIALVAPASVHRTWADVLQSQELSQARNLERELRARLPEVRAELERLDLAALFETKVAYQDDLRVMASGTATAILAALQRLTVKEES